MEDFKSRRWTKALVTALCATFLAGTCAWTAMHQLSSRFSGIDDANIYFRYARNLVCGNGLVWNPGGERVEGFTSFLWLLVCAATQFVWSKPEPILLFVSVLLIGVAIAAWILTQSKVVTARFERHSSALPLLPYLSLASYLLWLLSSPGFFIWTTATLLDSGLWTSIILMTFSAVIYVTHTNPGDPRASRLLAVLFGLLVLTRPEGAVQSVALLTILFLGQFGTRAGIGRSLHAIGLPLASTLLSLASLYTFRYLYFGYPLPNTYYAKIGPNVLDNIASGWPYVLSFMRAYPVAGLGVVLSLPGAVVWTASALSNEGFSRKPRTALGLGLFGASSLVLIAGIVGTLFCGGDHFDQWRFLQPYWPYVYTELLGFLMCVSEIVIPPGLNIPAPRRLLLSYTAGCVAALITYALSPVKWHNLAETSDLGIEFHIAEEGRDIGTSLNQMFKSENRPSVGVLAAGALPLTWSGPSIDLLGLNSVAMAHSGSPRSQFKNHAAFDISIFYELAPDILVLAVESKCRVDTSVDEFRRIHFLNEPPLRGLLHESAFRLRYSPVVFLAPGFAASGIGVCGYLKRSLLKGYQKRGFIREIAFGA